MQIYSGKKFWVKTFGPDVNLGNVTPDVIIETEQHALGRQGHWIFLKIRLALKRIRPSFFIKANGLCSGKAMGSTIVFNRESFHIVAANLDPWPCHVHSGL